MPVLLIVVGAIVAVLGLGTVAYGIPVKEFSFGNTLILVGGVAIVGGLVIIAIGAVVGQLQRIAEMLGARTPLQPTQPAELFDAPAPPHAMPPPPIPFPSRPKPPAADIPHPPPAAPAPPLAPAPPVAADQPAAPTLPNPEAPVSLGEQFEIPEHDDASGSPPPMPTPPPAQSDNELSPPPPLRSDKIFRPPPAHRPEPPPAFADVPWPSTPPPPPAPPRMEQQPQTSYFDTMWPADARPPKRPDEATPEAKSEVPPASAPGEPVAILKSGVVDGMAYTLYVDGSIEAELPHGTLRFASINELRDHLAKSA